MGPPGAAADETVAAAAAVKAVAAAAGGQHGEAHPLVFGAQGQEKRRLHGTDELYRRQPLHLL